MKRRRQTYANCVVPYLPSSWNLFSLLVHSRASLYSRGLRLSGWQSRPRTFAHRTGPRAVVLSCWHRLRYDTHYNVDVLHS
eukprot:6190866-Pleurochrysis_carterae.AAC.2